MRVRVENGVAFACLTLGVMASGAGAQTSTPLTQPVSAPGPASTAPVPTPGTPVAASATDDYRLDTGDSILIDVMRHPDVTRTIQIPVDGKLRLPRLLTPISVRGLTTAELTEVLTRQLHDEGKLVLRPGQVSVSIIGTRIRRVFLTGTAGKNGDFNLQNNWHIRELVAATGGVGQADRVKAQINNPQRPAPITINLVRALREPESADNVLLMEGDTLVLNAPERKRIYLKGEGPRGVHEVDERFGLRQTLVELGISSNGFPGDLTRARLTRYTVPGDVTSEQTVSSINLLQIITDDNVPDVPLQDMDTLEIPVSQNFVYVFGQSSAPKRQPIPADRKTYLADIMISGDTFANAKIGSVTIARPPKPQLGGAAFGAANATPNDPTGGIQRREYDFGKFLAKGDLRQNPEILPGDLIFIPPVKRTDVPNTIWTGWGFYNILQTLVPGIRPR